MRRISCLLGTLGIAACSGGVEAGEALGAVHAPLLHASFAIGDTAAGPTRNSEESPSVVAGNGDFGALWFEPDKGYAFARFEVVDGRLEPVVHTHPITSELFTSWSGQWYTPTLFFDGAHYRIRYDYQHTDTSFESRILTLDSQGMASADLADAPGLTDQIECSPAGVCLFAQNGSTSGSPRVLYTLLGSGGELSSVAPLELEPETHLSQIQLARVGGSFAVVVSGVNHGEGAATSRRLSMWTVSDSGHVEGPRALTATDRIDSFDVTSHGGELLAVFAAGPALHSVRVDGAGNVTKRLLTEQPWRIEAPLTVKSVEPGFLVSFNLAYVNEVSARVMAFSADGTADAAEARVLSSPGAGKMVNPSLASDGQRAAVVANGSEAYHHGAPPYLADDHPRLSVYGQTLGPTSAGADQLARIAHGEAAQLHPSVSWNGTSFTTAWVDNRRGWERLQLRGATVAGKSASVYPLATSEHSAALTGVHSATQGARTLFAWHQRTYVTDPGVGSYDDRDRVRALLVDEHGAPAGGIIELSSDADLAVGTRVATNGRDFLVTWCDVSCHRVMAAQVSAEGTLVGEPLVVANAHVSESSRPALAFTGSAYLVAWVPSWRESEGSRRKMGAALVRDGVVTPLALPEAYSTRTIDVACGTAGCMLVRDDDDGIYMLRVDAEGVAQGEWTRTPGKALNHPRVAFTGESFLITALDVTGDEWSFGTDPVIRGAYMLEYELDGTVSADFVQLDIETAGPVEVASDGEASSLLVFPGAETGLIAGLYLGPLAEPSEPDADVDAGTDEPAPEDDGGARPAADAGEGGEPVADAGSDAPDASGIDAGAPRERGSECHMRAGRSDRMASLALMLLGATWMLAARRRRRAGSRL
jgi:hypothetical protein